MWTVNVRRRPRRASFRRRRSRGRVDCRGLRLIQRLNDIAVAANLIREKQVQRLPVLDAQQAQGKEPEWVSLRYSQYISCTWLST